MGLINVMRDAQPNGCTAGRHLYGSWQWWGEGILCFTPHHSTTQSLVLSAGIHGNETAPVEMLDRLLTRLLAGHMAINWHLLIVMGNPEALRQNKRYIDADLNRLFGGRWRHQPPCQETHLAARLEGALQRFWPGPPSTRRWHIDMHTAIRDSNHPCFGVLPAGAGNFEPAFMAWLGGAGLEALVYHRAPAGTFSHYSSEFFAANSCTLELGKARPFGQNRRSDFQPTEQALYRLLGGNSWLEGGSTLQIYQVNRQIIRRGEQFTLHIPHNTLNFTPMIQGTLLAEEGATRWRVELPWEFVLFPNPNVADGQRAALMLAKMT